MSSHRKKTIAALIMAAGKSQRFGRCKPLASYRDSTILQQAIDTANQALRDHVYVATGAYHEAIKQHSKNARLIYCPEWEKGLGHSIAEGVNTLSPEYDAILIMLADQVGITSLHIKNIVQAFIEQPTIVCAHYRGSHGVPALFPAQYFSGLKKLTGDRGAKQLLNGEKNIQVIDLPEAAIDIDTIDDWINSISPSRA